MMVDSITYAVSLDAPIWIGISNKCRKSEAKHSAA
jgi:hypothetical protein